MEWLGLTPGTPERLTGGIEVPALAQSLTLNKADFIRSGPRGATLLAYRKAIQEAVSRQLALWGDGAEPPDQSRRHVARPVERDLEQVLADLASDFPLIAALVERHRGGQRRLPGAARASATLETGASAITEELVAGVPASRESPTARSAGAGGGIRAPAARCRHPPSLPRRMGPAAARVARVATGSRSTSNTGPTIPS